MKFKYIYKKIFSAILLYVICIHISTSVVAAQTTSTIDGNLYRQHIDGFGASSAFLTRQITSLSSTLQTSLYDMLFSVPNGIGLSIFRNRISPYILTSNGTYDFNIQDEVTGRIIMNAAKSRGVTKFYAVPWTPPAWMKTNNSVNNGGELLPQYYQAYADLFSNYVRTYKNTYGLDISVVSIQNEPDYTATYESARWSGQQIHDFIKNNLYPTFVRDNVTAKIMAAEPTGWTEGAAANTLTDTATSNMLDIVAAHKYAGSYSLFSNATRLNKAVWETEVSNLNANDSSITDGLRWAKDIHFALIQGNVNAWLYWWFATADSTGQALINFSSSNISPNKRFYTVGNYSKYIRPDYYRIDAPSAPQPGTYLTAFRWPGSSAFVIVVINDNTTATPISLTLQNLTAANVTPLVTSGTKNLLPQPTVSITNNQFSYTLDPKSVTTFVSPDALNPGQLPPPPQVTPAPPPAPCSTRTGDIDNSGTVTVMDLTAIIGYYSTNNQTGDLNCDGIVNNVDIAILLRNLR
jgi:glucuronoarabinoxylan endo-1,4-beta-xylanase